MSVGEINQNEETNQIVPTQTTPTPAQIDTQGILVYGLNCSGKSTCQKSVGICLILAQIGYFVPAKQMKFYPFKTLITRMSGDDNIFKGQSSFMVEMYEMKNILKRADDKTLVIADELCRGTEY